MSGLIVGLVLRQPIAKEFNSEAKFVATVYADHAWEDGTHAYPAVDTVAGITGYSSRTVQRYLRTLDAIGMMKPAGKGPRGTTSYDFPLHINEDGSVRLAMRGGDTVTPPEEKPADSGDSLTGCQPDGVTGNRVTSPSGDTSVTRIPVTQTNNPSLDLVVNEADVARIAKLYESEIGALTPLVADAIRDALQTYPADWIPEAIAIAVQNNARRWNYVEAILKNCKTAGKRPSLNRLENKNGNTRTGNKSGSKTAGQAQADTSQPYSGADLAAAKLVKSKQRKPTQVP